jgi:hypothetical protein
MREGDAFSHVFVILSVDYSPFMCVFRQPLTIHAEQLDWRELAVAVAGLSGRFRGRPDQR